MKKYQIYLISLSIVVPFFVSAVWWNPLTWFQNEIQFGAPVSNVFRNLLPESNDTYDIGTTTPAAEWKNVYAQNITVSGTCTGCSSLSGGSTNALTYWISGTTIGATSSQPLYIGSLVATTTNASSTLFNLFGRNLQVNEISLSNETATGTVNFASSTLLMPQYPSFTYATSTAWTGTTTIPLGIAYVKETWYGVQCFTDAGTLNLDFSDGTNLMNEFNASTTVGTVSFTTNNTFVAAEKRQVAIGTPASSPTKISCTIYKVINQ